MFFALALATTLQFQAALHKAEDSTVFVHMTDNRVVVETLEEQTQKASCSGVAIQAKGTDIMVITARHCAEVTEELNLEGNTVRETVTPTYVQFFDGDIGKVQAMATAANDDVAVLLVHSMRKHKVAHMTRAFHPNQDLLVYGSPLGNPWSATRAVAMQGKVPSHSNWPWYYSYLIDCAACAPGDSGAGVFDIHGDVVGIMVARNAYFGLITPASRIYDAGYLIRT